jgi:hypothetical protein
MEGQSVGVIFTEIIIDHMLYCIRMNYLSIIKIILSVRR